MRSSVRRFVLGAVVLVLGGLIALGLVSGAIVGAARSVLYATGGLVDGGSPTVSPSSTQSSSTASPTPVPTPSATPDGVLQDLGDESDESRTRLAKTIAGVSTGGMGGRWSGTVSAPGAAKPLFRHNGTTGFIPASTMKLLTSTAALELLGPDHRFTTKVVPGSGRQIVLVGGGDPYLATKPTNGYPATSSLLTLAADTADALRKAKRTSVTLGYDNSLFSGPDWSPRWPSTYGDQVTHVSALWVDEGRVSGYSPGPRVADPAEDAARTFAALLRKQGITVSGVDQVSASSAAPLAVARSMPLSAIVGETLLHSDNDAAETLLRQVGLASGHTGSFKGGVVGVEKTLKQIGAWDESTTLYDGSGLSRDNRVSSDQLVEVISTAAAPEHAKLRSLLTGMPTAAVDGSLRYRYGDDAGRAGRGVLRAKTGTLTKVHSLAGWTVTKDGSVLVFAFVANDMKNDYASTQWLEHVTAAVAGCGCSG